MEVSEEVKNLTDGANAAALTPRDVEQTLEIIDSLVNFSSNASILRISENILGTVNSIHNNTPSEVFSEDATASKIRNTTGGD